MSSRQPPALAIWLLDGLGYTRQNAALAGDLLEEFRSGRSAGWYWRQALMVILHGVCRNAVVVQTYLKAMLAGFGLQIAVAFVLWRSHSPHRIQEAGWLILAIVLLVLGLFLVYPFKYLFLRWLGKGKGTSDLSLLLARGSEDEPRRPALIVLAAGHFFVSYLICYALLAVSQVSFPLSELVAYEIFWMASELVCAVALVPATGGAPIEEMAASAAAPPEERLAWPLANELVLRVGLADGLTILLRPETAAESVFVAADPELAATLLERGAGLEQIRRAIRLACADNYLKLCIDPNSTPAISLVELAVFVDAAARAQHFAGYFYPQGRLNYWQRLRRFWRREAGRQTTQNDRLSH